MGKELKRGGRRKIFEKKSTCMKDKPKGVTCDKVKAGWVRRRTK